MSIQINIGDHVSRLAPLFQPVPFRHHWVTNWARRRAQVIAQTMPSADKYFRSLPLRRSLSSILSDRNIWINYAPTLTDLWGAADMRSHMEVAITPPAYLWGRWTVLATLIHELAHVNGAPIVSSRAAEDALLHCGLGKHGEATSGIDDPRTPFDPGTDG